MSDLREADASPPPEVRPERPQRSPRRNLSAVSIEEQKTWPHNRLGSVGLDAVGEFTRRKQDYQKSWNESQGTMRSATLASLAQEENRRRSMPSGSSSSSSSHSASAASHRSAKHSPRAASLTNAPISTIRRKTALADPSRNQRQAQFIDQVNQVLSPPVSPDKASSKSSPRSSHSHRAREEAVLSDDSKGKGLRNQPAEYESDSESSYTNSKRGSMESSRSDHTARRVRSASYSQQSYNDAADASFTSKSGTPSDDMFPDLGSTPVPRRRSAQYRATVKPTAPFGDETPPVPLSSHAPFPSASARSRGSQTVGHSASSGSKPRPSLPAEFGMRTKHSDSSPQASPSYLSPRELGRKDRAVSPVSPTFSAASLSKAGSARLRQHLQQGDSEGLPPPPPAAYPQHYQTSNSSVRDRERERKRSMLSSGSGGQRSNATSGSNGSGSRDEQDRYRSSSSALLRRSTSPPSTVSSRYASSRAPPMDQKEEPLPPRPGSAAWWNELDDLKAKTRYTPGRTTAQSHHRSQQSRSHSRMSFQDDDEDTSVVQEESDLTRTPVTGSMRRRAYQRHPRAQSVLEGAAITSAPSRLRSTADFNSAGGPARSRTAMGLNGDDSSPASAGTARNGPVESPLRHRRDLYEQADSSTRSHPASPGLPRRSPLKTAGNEHHRLLGEAMEHLERFSGTRSGSGPSFGHTPEHVRKLAIVSDLTTSLNSELRTLVADLVEAQVEAEMSMETNGQTGPETSLDQTIKQTERRLARLLRTSDEQVRGLTESALAISRYSREQDADNTKRSESRATTARPSLEEDRSYMEEDGEGANVSRSRSLGTGITQRRARRYQTQSEVPSTNYTSRRPKDSTGTVKAGPAFHYPRHSVASTSALSNETAQANHSQSQSGRTRAISLDADPYDYSYEDRSDEEETMVMSKGTSRRDTMSESEDYDQHPRRRRPSAAERSTAAAALRLGLGALTAEGIGSRYRSRKKPSQ